VKQNPVPEEPRLDRLEERLAWLERHVAEQDRAMLDLAEENLRLRQELTRWQARVSNAGIQEGQPGGGLGEEERPPHY
jgi:SlyX protein